MAKNDTKSQANNIMSNRPKFLTIAKNCQKYPKILPPEVYLTVIFILAGTEQVMLKSTSTSCLVGVFLKLIPRKCLSSALLKLKVN